MASPRYSNVVRIVEQAYREARIIGHGQVLNSERYAFGFNRLIDLIQVLLTEGVKLFELQEYTLTAPILAAGTRDYVFGPGQMVNMTRPMRVEQMRFVEFGSASMRPMTELSLQEWNTLGNVTAQGAVTQFLQRRFPTNLTISLWNIPDTQAATGSIVILFRNSITQYTSLMDSTQFPPEWYLPLVWMLADEICGSQPQEIQARCKMKAEEMRAIVEGWDTETAQTFLSMDQRYGYDRQGF